MFRKIFGSKTVLKEKLIESAKSVLPISAIVLLLCFTIAPIEMSHFTSFIFGSFILILGISLFTLGAEVSMTPMGEYVGAQMTRSKKIWLIVLLSFVVGFMITMSEPDLQVLATYVPSINPSILLIASVAAGVGVFLVIAMLRIIFGINLKWLLLGFYIIAFTLALFVNPDFWSVAFDSGGVTTGPMTVPFIMALGVGISSIRSDNKESSDSFGLVSLCSVGPIISVLILGLIYNPESSSGALFSPESMESSRELGWNYLSSLPHYLLEVTKAVLPIVAFFFIYQAFTKPLGKKALLKIAIGLVYTYVGLVLFLTGANVGFMPVGYLIGAGLGSQGALSFIVIPIGMIIGYFIVAAEPAVQVLQTQVEDVTSGAIPKRALAFALEIGVAISVGIAMLRALTGISIMYFLIPGYIIAFILTFFVPDIFTSIAFDSGGVASGAMTSTFLLPFAIGVCTASGNNIATDAFGTVAMVAMTPLIAIQILGVVYKIRISRIKDATPSLEEIIDMQADAPVYEFSDENDQIQIISLSNTIVDDEIIDFD
ncbi:MAG: DUF1538 domain-containing protein [Clostridia bacterium]|nr:DUF1538 domain-containing protein [Clostridia bacterium]